MSLEGGNFHYYSFNGSIGKEAAMYQTCFRVVVFLSFFFTTNLLGNFFSLYQMGEISESFQ